MSVLSRAGRIARTIVHLLVVHRSARTCIAILIIVIASIIDLALAKISPGENSS